MTPGLTAYVACSLALFAFVFAVDFFGGDPGDEPIAWASLAMAFWAICVLVAQRV